MDCVVIGAGKASPNSLLRVVALSSGRKNFVNRPLAA